MTQTPRFKIGTTYRPVGQKNDTVHTVVDVWVTRDSKGEIVQIRYVSEHTFCGPILKTYDVLETTIARGLIAEGTVDPGLCLPEPTVSTLRFYADPANWKDVETGIGGYPGEAMDYGHRAQAALQALEA